MTAPAPAVAACLTGLMRDDRGRLLAALIAGLGRFDLAEDALADAIESAFVHWGRAGLPDNPRGWLLRVARRKAIDRIRRAGRWRDRMPDIALLAAADEAAAAEPPPDIPDERLRLIFACCHPALDPKSRVALTLRTLGGLTVPEIARAFLDRDTAMGQRISRAKAKIAAAGIPFAVPDPQDWAARRDSVLAVIYLIFNEGYAVTAGAVPQRVDLCAEALFLGEMLAGLMPQEPEAIGLLALMRTTHARVKARLDAQGNLVTLSQQDRSIWDAGLIRDGLANLDRALLLGQPGPYQIKAAISALHVSAPDHGATDWRQMLLLYDSLLHHEPTDVVRLNRAVVLAELGGVAEALRVLEGLAPRMQDYQPFHAARAELLMRDGQVPAARAAFSRAIALSGNDAERQYLQRRAAALATAQKKAGPQGPAKSNREV